MKLHEMSTWTVSVTGRKDTCLYLENAWKLSIGANLNGTVVSNRIFFTHFSTLLPELTQNYSTTSKNQHNFQDRMFGSYICCITTPPQWWKFWPVFHANWKRLRSMQKQVTNWSPKIDLHNTLQCHKYMSHAQTHS